MYILVCGGKKEEISDTNV